MYKVKDDVMISNRGNQELLVLNDDDTHKFYYKISGIAADILLAIYEKKNSNDIKIKILNEYKVSEQELNKDLNEYIQFLIKNGIIE